MHYFLDKSFGVNGKGEIRLKKLYFTAVEITWKLFSLSKIPLLPTFKAKKQNRNFVSKLRFIFGAGEGT